MTDTTRLAVSTTGALVRSISRRLILAALSSAAIFGVPFARAVESPNGLVVTIPNGFANLNAEDMRVASTAGAVRWIRRWDGQEWKFNPQWESLSQSWANLTGSQTADTTGSTLSDGGSVALSGSSGGGSGCWVWVDEDWKPSVGIAVIGGIPEAAPLLPARSMPFNRVMGEASADYPALQRVSVDYASLCVGTAVTGGSTLREAEGIRRINELYLGDAGRYAFNNRSILEKRSVQQLGAVSADVLYASLGTGRIALAPETNTKGFRWIDKAGDWIDYNTQGQVVAWGDRNGNTVWLARDMGGVVRGVVDANGRVVFSLHYTGELLTEVRDYPIAGLAEDLPARTVKYRYDDKNRLVEVTDVRGNLINYGYDAQNRIVSITDQERRVEQITYSGAMVKSRTTDDGAVTDYQFEYDDTNKQFISKITGPETAAGRRVDDYTHNRVGKLVRRIVNGRTDEEVRYDTGVRAELVTNARGFTTRTTRNEFDQIVEVAYPDGAAVKRAYSALHLGLVEETDELGIKTRYEHDAKGNLLKRTEAVGTSDERVTDYEVNALGQTVKVIRRGRTEINGMVTADAIWQIAFDAQGQIGSMTDPEGHARRYAYDRAGQLARVTDPRGYVTRYEREAAGNLIQITDALGRAQSLVYDKVGNLTQLTDARAKITRGVYDAMNRLARTISPVGGVRMLQYNGQGLLVADTDEDGRSTRTEFDNFLRLTRQVDGLSHVTEHRYTIGDGTEVGTLGSLYGPTETQYPTFVRRQRYDERERPTSETLLNTNALGTESLVSTTSYDKRGRIKSTTDANGKTSYQVWDALGKLVEVTDALGNKTRAVFDARGNLILFTDAKGNATRFEFDRNDRIVKEVLPLGQVTHFTYDENGNLASRVDPNGHKIAYAYDPANRIREIKQYRGGNFLVRTTTFTWDAADNLAGWSDVDHKRNETASSSATYDDANRKTGETVTYPGGYSLNYGYAYSPAGKKTKLTWADGTVIDYGYSAHGELETVTIPGEGTLSVNQFKWLEPAKITLPGGTTQELTLDGLLYPESLKVRNPSQQAMLSIANTWGEVQELKQSNRTETVGSASSTRNTTYRYDDELRLVEETVDTGGLFGAHAETFTLDAVANRIAHSAVAGAWSYDANNRLSQSGTGSAATTYEYDEGGSLTRTSGPIDLITRYAYDTQGRLAEVMDGNGNIIARYGYDPLNRRIWKEQYRDRSRDALAKPKRTYYLYADEGLIAEATQMLEVSTIDGSVNASSDPRVTTQYGPRPNSEFTTGVLFIKAVSEKGEGTLAYYQHDHQQTPVQAIDKAGIVVWAANYNAFGRATISTPISGTDRPAISSNLRLPGQYFDEETGLHYNWHRYYDPAIGRYITQDPIGLNGGFNRFVYSNARPTYESDPTGLVPNNSRGPTICKGTDCVEPPFDPTADGPRPSPSPPQKEPSNPLMPAKCNWLFKKLGLCNECPDLPGVKTYFQCQLCCSNAQGALRSGSVSVCIIKCSRKFKDPTNPNPDLGKLPQDTCRVG